MLLSDPVPATRNLLEVLVEVCLSLEIVTKVENAESDVNICDFDACLQRFSCAICVTARLCIVPKRELNTGRLATPAEIDDYDTYLISLESKCVLLSH